MSRCTAFLLIKHSDSCRRFFPGRRPGTRSLLPFSTFCVPFAPSDFRKHPSGMRLAASPLVALEERLEFMKAEVLVTTLVQARRDQELQRMGRAE